MGIEGLISRTPAVIADPFVHLHVHSAYSLLEGALPLKKIIDAAVADAQPAVAVTDRNNLFGSLEFSEYAVKAGLQPIIGCKIDVDMGPLGERNSARHRGDYLIVLATSQRGIANIAEIVSHAYRNEPDLTRPSVPLDVFRNWNEGLVVLTGGVEGPVNAALREGQIDEADRRLRKLHSIFNGSLYVEVQRHHGHSRPTEDALLNLAYEQNLPLVATNEVYFPKREDYEAHDALVCIAEGRRVEEQDRRRLTVDHYLKKSHEMGAIFDDLPEAISNTMEIAQRCAIRSVTRAPILPSFAADPNAEAEEAVAAEAAELRRQALAGLDMRIEKHGMADGFERVDYDKRLEYELGVIENMKFPGYFLIVADFIRWAKEQGIPVGPGRGSGAGSLVAWSLTVTDLDPMRFSLLFERFLNPERISMPDFDIDFCQERRDEVIRYVQERYGREQVAQIITFGRLQARAVLRDVGRVLQLPFGQVDRLCKMVPNNPANPVTLAEAIDGEIALREARDEDSNVRRLIDISLKLEGLFRHASTHAAGIVIGDRPLQQLVPLYRDPGSDMPVTQLNMKWVEQAGLVKFDFLGLKTLTVLQTAIEFVARKGEEVAIDALPLDDAPTYEMLQRGETVGVFQLESVGMRKALVGMKADRFEDIIALVALYRPGPMDNIPSYNRRKQGLEETDTIHPKIAKVLGETHGIIIYQEQVMEIAQILSGYSLGEADMLRRAMGKKIKSEMDAQKGRFVSGAVENGLTGKKADEIFELLAKFANYGFNKSHAAAYALISYQTAWLKANHPVEFLAASMCLDMGNTDKLNDFHREAKRAGIEVHGPSVNTSEVRFNVAKGAIHYALAAIKGVGQAAMQHIVDVRNEDGEYRSLTDFFTRIDPKQLNRRMLEALVHAGAFDCFGSSREQVIAGLDRLLGHASRIADNNATGIIDMFGADTGETEVDLPRSEPWPLATKLLNEFSAVGFYLTGHPLDEYAEVLGKLRVQNHEQFLAGARRGAKFGKLAATIASRQERRTRTGGKMGIVNLSDPSGQYEAVIFSEGLAKYRETLEAGRSVMLNVEAVQRDAEVSLQIQSVTSLDDELSRVKQTLRIFVESPAPIGTLCEHLLDEGEGRVAFVVLDKASGREVELELSGSRKVSNDLRSAAMSLDGVLQAELV